VGFPAATSAAFLKKSLSGRNFLYTRHSMRKISTLLLMLMVNFGILITLSFFLRVTGLERYLLQSGIGYQGLAIFCLIFGMGASFISLLLSKRLVKWRMKIQLVDGSHPNPDARRLYEMVQHLALKAGLPKTPEVGIYESPEVNAFATGPSQDDALVAVSTGLISSMRWEETQGVLGHEISHIANGDMVRMTLLQGVMNALVMFVSRIAAQIVVSAMRGDRDERRGGNFFLQFMIVQLFEVVLGLLGMMVVNYYSRFREFRADRGGAALAGRQNMIQALQALQSRVEFVEKARADLQTMKISSGRSGMMSKLFSTHPPLADRIAALQSA
jgi:heat shock protein HtpX